MPLDRTTEAIAHFIGLFQVEIEEMRLRDAYDSFRARPPENTEDSDLVKVTISFRAPHELQGVEVSGSAMGTAQSPAREFVPTPVAELQPATQPTPAEISAQVETPTPDPEMLNPTSAIVLRWEIPLPNTVVTVTVQTIHMNDNDILVFDDDLHFVDPDAFTAELMELAVVADSLGFGLSELMEPGHIPSADAILAAFAEAQLVTEAAPEGAHVAVIQGEALAGIFVNGEAAEEIPDFNDSLPRSMQNAETDDTDGVTEIALPVSPFAVEDGHHVSTGENLTANEAHIVKNWVDAEVIAVAGDVIQVNIISQVNVLSDQDFGPGAPGTPSATINAAKIESVSSAPDDAEPVSRPAADPVFPQHWQVERVDGDVVLENWVQSHIFATDNDCAQVVLTGSNTSIGLGENALGNYTSLIELGFHYDLIIVGGDMISMNFIEQVNVLHDDDVILGDGWGDAIVEGGDNLLMNAAAICETGIDTTIAMTDPFRADLDALAAGASDISDAVAKDALFAGKDALSVLYISGDLIEFNAIQQVTHLGDADQVQAALADILASGGDLTVNSGSNAMLNAATIEDLGIDSTVLAGGDVYSDALIHQAELIDMDSLPDGVALTALTNEAVAAFLSPDMIDGNPVATDDADAIAPIPADAGNLDVMQSALS
ncbi:hypothetical protein LV82_01198 [Albidovulum inexpectatum]|uniref:Type I secretion protein n=1 Tax=Albidovulum inexpectatum TaxID=196587 RepID=A0A2S5JHZ3_9RHOB|nr:hypothetical protein [Albidovulum inexpectatum]PPB81156.1 hypothetical protein LV82_01198 [Albidovulum inexpectatum]